MRSDELADRLDHLVSRLRRRILDSAALAQVPLTPTVVGLANMIHSIRDRITGVGAQQYDDGSGTQKFERLPLDELLTWALEELDDVMVYAGMLRIRIERLQAALKEQLPPE